MKNKEITFKTINIIFFILIAVICVMLILPYFTLSVKSSMGIYGVNADNYISTLGAIQHVHGNDVSATLSVSYATAMSGVQGVQPSMLTELAGFLDTMGFLIILFAITVIIIMAGLLWIRQDDLSSSVVLCPYPLLVLLIAEVIVPIIVDSQMRGYINSKLGGLNDISGGAIGEMAANFSVYPTPFLIVAGALILLMSVVYFLISRNKISVAC